MLKDGNVSHLRSERTLKTIDTQETPTSAAPEIQAVKSKVDRFHAEVQLSKAGEQSSEH